MKKVCTERVKDSSATEQSWIHVRVDSILRSQTSRKLLKVIILLKTTRAVLTSTVKTFVLVARLYLLNEKFETVSRRHEKAKDVITCVILRPQPSENQISK